MDNYSKTDLYNIRSNERKFKKLKNLSLPFEYKIKKYKFFPFMYSTRTENISPKRTHAIVLTFGTNIKLIYIYLKF